MRRTTQVLAGGFSAAMLALAGGCDDLDAGSALSGAVEHSRVTVQEVNLKAIADSIRMFQLSMDRLPTQNEGLDVLLSADKLESGHSNWQGPYASSPASLQDKYGNRIIYEVTPTGFRLISLGADGERGGSGISADAVYESSGL